MNRLLSIVLVCLLQWSLAVASTFSLKVEVTPNGAGTLNTSGGTYEEGKSINLRTYSNTGYVFKGWYDGETFLTSSTSFNYTMPARDATVQARYEFDPKAPDNPSMPDTTTYYSLTAIISPIGAGSVNTTNGRYAAGTQVNMRAYNNSGYLFIGWQNEKGETVSSSASFTYIMPRHDSQLTALYTFDPSVPANPDPHAPSYTVTVACKPVGGGTFNTTSISQEEGGNVRLYAYTNTGYQFLHWENENGDTLSKEQNFYYVIPHGNSKVYGIFEFNPTNPANPNKNYWNKELGELIIDDFTTGSLGNAASSAISGSNRSDVAMIIVAGRMNDNDFGIANNYTNCTLLDLSRVTGVTEVPSYAFDNTNLESVYLPATIEKIGARAFYGCSRLSSLTVYAMTPPTLESNVFTNVPEGLVVYVPAAALAQYQEAEGWKNFTLLPIQEDIRNMSVNLPANANSSDYVDLWLELTNIKSGQRMHYVMKDQMTYTFHNIIRNTEWNVTLRNEKGDVFGQIDNVEVKDEDVSVTFVTLSKPQDVNLTIMTPEGKDVTEQTEVTWTDASGNYIAQGTSLTGLPIGFQLNYQVGLSQELAMTYLAPQPTEYILKDGSNDVVCQLHPIAQVQISGKVKDAVTGLPLADAIVSASQTFGGKYGKTMNAKTDRNGTFTLDIANVPTMVGFAATDYVSQTIVCDSLMNGKTALALPDVSLHPITGATVSIEFTYTSVDGETVNWYTDYQNVDYTLFNVTKNRDISQYNVQYPQIVLMEEVADGDVIRLTATSRTNAFMPVTSTATVSDQRATASFGITELGKIQASFTRTDNAAVVGTLYDAAGKLLKTYDYYNASLTISDLADGQYTLVSMGTSDFFNTIYDIAQLPQTGLAVGTDYVQQTIEVKSGAVSTISIDEVPTLNESKLYYTGDNTSFTVNKPNIVVGNYLTLTGRIDFKPAYATTVSNVQIIVDLPESCEFVENSVMVGNGTSTYTLNGNRIIIPMTRYTDRVRFCVIPTLGGEYAPSAFAQFDLNGKSITQPIGSAYYTAKDLSISVPSTVAKTSIPVSGTAIGTSNVDIYDNDVLIGQTTSLANGTWATTCELNDSYNLSTHNIYAKVTTKSGIGLVSETVSCLYDKNAIEVSTVTMINTAHTSANLDLYDYVTVFDFQNPKESYPAYWYWPSYPDFTFLVDFTNNDTTIVKDVVLYVFTDHDDIVMLYPEYDAKKDKFVATAKFNSYSLPYNVSVDFHAETEGEIDSYSLHEPLNLATSIQGELMDEVQLINETFETGSEGEIDNLLESLGITDDFLASHVNMDSLQIAFESMSETELQNAINAFFSQDSLDYSLMNDEINNVLKSFYYDEDWNEIKFEDVVIKRMEVTPTDTINAVSLGYERFKCDNGEYVYIKQDSCYFEVIDVSQKIRYSISFTNPESAARLMRKAGVFTSDNIREWSKLLVGAVDHVKKVFEHLDQTLDDLLKPLRSKQHSLAGRKGWLVKMKKTCNPAMLHIYNDEIKSIDKQLALVGTAIKGIQKVARAVAKYMPVAKYALIASDAVIDLNKLYSVYKTIPNPCPDDQALATDYQWDVFQKAGYTFSYYMGYLSYDVSATVASVSQMAAAIPSGGTTIVSAILTELAKFGAECLANYVKDKLLNSYVRKMSNKISKLKCFLPPPPPPPPTPPGGGVPNVKDPSGYVYEGVTSNRIEGVTATAYYKEMVEDMYGDLHENIVKWDASEYAQENPLFTNEYGMYAWDVPNGLWQVKFEKEGYETTYSDWLPVPPPQLDINIAMKQNRQPEVKMARAFEDAVELEFDKYMMPELLTTDNIMVIQNGTAVEGTIELLNEEVSYEGEEETFASKVRFNAAQPFTEKEVTLMVTNRVKSYAGIRMQDDYQQTFAIEQEIKQIVCDSLLSVGYGNSKTMTVTVLPASASQGKTLYVNLSSSMILGIETNQVTIGSDGTAQITVTGELPGTAALTFSVDGTDKTAMTIANVEQVIYKTVAMPTTSIASGTLVDMGTLITLSCATEGAIIYYTLDGSCPCDESANRFIYDGTPIVINGNVTIKAMAVIPGMSESDVAEFVYTVDGIEEVTWNDYIQVYPLPLRQKVNVKAGGKTIKSVTIASMNGTVVASSTKVSKEVGLDVSLIPTGVYIIHVLTEDSTFSRKILKIE